MTGAEKMMQNEEIESKLRFDKPEAVFCVQRVVRFIDSARFIRPY